MRISSFVLMGVAMLPFSCLAQEENSPVSPIEAHMQDVREAWPEHGVTMHGAVKFVFGNDQWQPGHQFENGANWLALACTLKGCALEPASLTVVDESWQGHYDDEATAGQHLMFKQNAGANAVAWFKTTGAPAWLKPGVVSTYYSRLETPKQPSSPGTLEVLIELPDGESATLVPMMPAAEVRPASSGYPAYYSGSYFLQLRSQGKRQLLLGELGSCSHAVDLSYLQWAGDLDGDSKADYLISFIDADGPVHLYLSSTAKDGQLVGLAGVYASPPFGGECDGDGWAM